MSLPADPARDPNVDEAHDPGFREARMRAERSGVERAEPVAPAGGGRVYVGTAGWTDATLTAPGVFYPDGVRTADARLRYYASRFAMVEVDAPYYALPTASMAELWVQRTPPGFRFDVKAHALMTGHPSEVSRLPKVLREALPADVAAKPRVYARDLPPEVDDAVWGGYVDAIRPLHAAGRLGAVLLQYPRWFVPGARSRDEIVRARERLEGLPCSVEFRNHRWFTPDTAAQTLAFLEEQRLPFVMVDEPQGLQSSVPPLVAVTSPDLAVIRLHGRRGDQWERRGTTVAEKYRYLYDAAQLAEWVPRVAQVAAAAREVHVVFNNCYGNYGTTNALELAGMIGA